jgi:hypothetical protein
LNECEQFGGREAAHRPDLAGEVRLVGVSAAGRGGGQRRAFGEQSDRALEPGDPAHGRGGQPDLPPEPQFEVTPAHREPLGQGSDAHAVTLQLPPGVRDRRIDLDRVFQETGEVGVEHGEPSGPPRYGDEPFDEFRPEQAAQGNRATDQIGRRKTEQRPHTERREPDRDTAAPHGLLEHRGRRADPGDHPRRAGEIDDRRGEIERQNAVRQRPARARPEPAVADDVRPQRPDRPTTGVFARRGLRIEGHRMNVRHRG